MKIFYYKGNELQKMKYVLSLFLLIQKLIFLLIEVLLSNYISALSVYVNTARSH